VSGRPPVLIYAGLILTVLSIPLMGDIRRS
jgi:hypothetical protein